METRRSAACLIGILLAFACFLEDAVVESLKINECPSNWLKFGGSCYLFSRFLPLSRDQAIFQCGTHGGGLVSVEDKREHDFLVKWLQLHDGDLQTWYTSGVRDVTHLGATILRWQTTGEAISDELLASVGTEFTLATGTLVYVHTDAGYTFGTATPSDEMPYICEVPMQESYRIIQIQRDFDYGLTTTDVNSLDKGPHFIVQPMSTVVVGNRDHVTLECVATAKPVPTYTWWKGSGLDVQVTPEVDSRYLITNGRLVIKYPVESKDSNMYQCRVENVHGTIVSNVAQISFGALGEFSNVAIAPVRAVAYQGAAIECSRITYNPAVAYQWYKNFATQFVRPRHQKYIFISQNGKLYFSEVTAADEGQYYCIALLTGRGQNTIGMSQAPTRTSLPISLMVQDQAPLADWGPQIQDEFIAVFPKPALRGQNVRLECFAYGSTTSEFIYSWKRKGKNLPSNAKLMDHSRVLILKDASLDDQGVYTCSVRRGASAKDERSIELKLGSKPYFIRPIGDQHVDIGAHFTWHCNVRASPASTFQWYKDGQVLTSDPQRSIKVTNNVITFVKLDPKLHDGMYQCAATNSYGTTLSEGQLRVLAIAPTFAKHPMQAETVAPIKGNLTLACRPEAAPVAQITWYKDGSELPPMSDVYEAQLDGHLVVRNVHEGSAGTFTCKAANELGEAQDNTRVIVAEGTFITVPPESQRVVVNSTVFFYCVASHAENSDLLYTWHFNGFLIDPIRQPEYNLVQEDAYGKTGLYIQGVNIHNMGEYECRATTTINRDSKTAFLTVIAAPSEPAGAFFDSKSVGKSGLDVRWTETSSNGRIIHSYIIESQSEFEKGKWEVAVSHIPRLDTIVEKEEKRFATVSGLNPGCAYRFRVIAVNDVGRSAPSKPTAYALLDSAPPTVAPLMVGGGGGSVGVLTMTWQPLTRTQHGGPGFGYNVFWRKKYDRKPMEENWRLKELRGNKDRHVSVEGIKNYYLEYEVKVQSFNHKGMGPNSTVATVMSAEDIPASTPTNVRADGYNGTAMEVTWDPVPDTREAAKGKILGYQINYWHEEDDPNLVKNFIRYEGQVDMGIAIGLKSDNFYYFTIQVYNSAGLGPISEFYFQETLHAPAFTYPQEVRVFSAGAYEVEVWWRGITISQPESGIRGYAIYYWPAHENHRTAKIKMVPNHLSYHSTIRVEQGVVYALRVSAFSDGGLGKKSLTQYFTLEGNNILIDFNLAQTVEAFVSVSMANSYHTTTTLAVTFALTLGGLLTSWHLSLWPS